MMNPMKPNERVRRVAMGLEADRVPTIAGWIGGARALAELAGIGVDQYVADPLAGAVAGTQALQADAIVVPVVPQCADQVRTQAILEESFSSGEPEDLVRYAQTLPDSDAGTLRQFDRGEAEASLRAHLTGLQRDWPGLVLIPNYWDIGGSFALYAQFGYVPFLTACAGYSPCRGQDLAASQPALPREGRHPRAPDQ